MICASTLTGAELATYRSSPETFFGVVQFVLPQMTEPSDCFDFIWGSYGRTTKESCSNL